VSAVPERVADEIRDAPEEADNLAMPYWIITTWQLSTTVSRSFQF